MEDKAIDYLDFLFVGAARSGTTSACVYLRDHPEICMPEKNKEPCFFIFVDSKEKTNTFTLKEVNSTSDYSGLFDHCVMNCKRGEGSTAYLYHYDVAIRNIKKYVKNWDELKIIIMLRNPVERAYSHYLYSVQEGFENRAFADCIKAWRDDRSLYGNYIGYGMYSSQVNAYMNNFNNVKVIIFDDFKNNSEAVIRSICEFLGVENNQELIKLEARNKTMRPRYRYSGFLKNNRISKQLKKFIPKPVTRQISRYLFAENLPKMQEKDKLFLMDLYREDILELSSLLKRDLSDWLV